MVQTRSLNFTSWLTFVTSSRTTVNICAVCRTGTEELSIYLPIYLLVASAFAYMSLLYSSRPMTQQEQRLASSSGVEVTAGWSEQSRLAPPASGAPVPSSARYPDASPGFAAVAAEREAAAQSANEIAQQKMDDLRTRQVQESLQHRQWLTDEENRVAGEAAQAQLEAFKREVFSIVPSSCRVAPSSSRAVAQPPSRNGCTGGVATTPRPRRMRNERSSVPQPLPNNGGGVHNTLIGRAPSPRLAQLVTPALDADLLPLLHHTARNVTASTAEQLPQQRHAHLVPPRSATLVSVTSRARSPTRRVGERIALVHSPANGMMHPVSSRAESQSHVPLTKPALWMPVPFSSSHFASVLHWAELSFQEAVVAAKGAVLATVAASDAARTSVNSGVATSASLGGQRAATYVPGHAGAILDRGVAPPPIQEAASGHLLPSHLTTVATCAIVDEVMSQLPGFESTWRQMRLELFGAIFCLTPSDVASSLDSDEPGADPDSTTPGNDGDHRHPQGGTSTRKKSAVTPANWFSRVCAKRGLWAHQKLRAEDREHALEQRLEEAKVSVTKHDRIFDVYSRSNDRVTLQRVFRVWRSLTVRSFNFLSSLDAAVARKMGKGVVSRAFYAWHRHLLRLKLKYSSDKTTSFSAVQEAKLKAKAQELAALQAQLEQETQRLRQQSEKDARKFAALVTSHEVEVRELQSLQDTKDQLVLSMEKIARRWERIAKTFRPISLQRGAPVAGSVLRAAQVLLDAEKQLARGPTQVRVTKGKHALQTMLCEWVNATLDEIGSRAPRIKNTASDLRDGESLLALCRHLVQKRSSQAQPSRGDAGAAAAAAPDSQVHLVHTAVTQALYLGTSSGLVPPLVSSSPRGSRIMARDGFLEMVGSTSLHAGLWILASLFVQDALETSRYSLDPSHVFHRWQPPKRVEHHVAEVVDVSLMLLSPDRSGPSWEDYPPLRLRRSLSGVEPDGTNGVGPTTTTAAATSSTDPFHDTASDIEYYLGLSAEAAGAPDHDAADERDDGAVQRHEFSDSDEALSDDGGGGVVGAADSGIPSASSFGPVGASEQRHGSFAAMGPGGDATTTAHRRGQGHPSSPLVASPRTIHIEGLGRQASARFVEANAAVVVTTAASAAFVDEEPLALDNAARTAVTGSCAAPQAPRQPAASAEVPLKPQSLSSALPPVRPDLRDCAMPALVRKLRREERALHSWTGLARLVTSVVLRFRVLDEASSSRQRSASLIPFSNDAYAAQAAAAVVQSEPMPPARAPSFASRDRLGSLIGGSGSAVAVQQQQQIAASVVPRVATAEGPPRHRTGSLSRPSVGANRGAAFFPEDVVGSATATPLLASLTPKSPHAPDGATTSATGNTTSSRRNTIKFS